VMGGTELVPVPADPAGAAVAYVFKTVADQFVGQVSLFKVLSGTVRADDRLVNTHTSTEERLHALFHLRGKEHVPVTQVVAGDIAAVAKLSSTPTHSTLAAKGSPVRVERPPVTAAAYNLALEPVTQSDDDKLSDALARLCSEDPTLSVLRSEETHQTVLCGAGDTHLAVALERLARKFGVNVTTAEQKVFNAFAPKTAEFITTLRDYAFELKRTVRPGFPVPATWREEFYRRLQGKGVIVDRVQYDLAAPEIDRLLGATVSRLAFGDSTARRRSIPDDLQLSRALQAMKQSQSQHDLFVLAQQQPALAEARKK